MESLVGFSSWREVLDYAQAGGLLYYKAPMDHRPIPLRKAIGDYPVPLTYDPRARTIKIWPHGSVGRGRNRTADPFTADSGHLGRFSRPDTQSGVARESGWDRRYSMTYGELPPFEQFEHDVHTRIDPNHTDGRAYWPPGSLYPMELVGAREIELAEDYGLDEFEAERARTGRNSRVRGFQGDETQIYGFLEYLVECLNDGDDEAGDLASSIMTTLGYEWI
jgi:hypothetical protein